MAAEEHTHARRPPPRQRLLRVVSLSLAAIGVLMLLTTIGPDRPRAERRDDDPGQFHTGFAPWPPVTDGLQARHNQARLPPVGDESYHQHALLAVFADGDRVEVPANIGIDPRSGFISSVHTHTRDGVVHIEAATPARVVLSHVFVIWGVLYDATRVGGYTAQGEQKVHVFVNGSPLTDYPPLYELNDGDVIVVAYGKEGSFPTSVDRAPLERLQNA